MLKNYKELIVWEKSYQLCLHIYKVTKRFPKDEMYGLTSQVRRSAVSIPSNIAEGYGRKTTTEYVRFLYIAYGSVCELETQTMLSGDLGYVGKEGFQILREEIGEVERMLKALIKSLENKHLDPWHEVKQTRYPGVLEPFLPTNWEKSLKTKANL